MNTLLDGFMFMFMLWVRANCSIASESFMENHHDDVCINYSHILPLLSFTFHEILPLQRLFFFFFLLYYMLLLVRHVLFMYVPYSYHAW